MLRDGLPFTVASGRALHSIRQLLRGLPLQIPVIELNGSLVSDLTTGTPIAVETLDPDLAEPVLAELTRLGLEPFIATAGRRTQQLHHAALRNPAMSWYRQEKVEIGDPRLCATTDLRSALCDPVLSFTLLDRADVLADAAGAIRAICGDRVQLHLFDHSYVRGFREFSVHAASATKARAVARVQDLLGVPTGALTVFGDNLNDLDLFRSAARAVAVANAVPEIAAAATELTESNDDDGVVRWLRRFHDRA
jgi:hydroxymethylpyrimidine pyrophosphatase-like HAD family hydrolase